MARTRPKGASPLANCGPVPWASVTASSLHIGGESAHGVAVEMKWHKSVWHESRIWVSGRARWTRVTLPLLCRLCRPLVVEERVGTSPPPAQPARWEAGVCAVFHHEGKTESQSGDEPARGARPVGAEAEVALKALQSCRMSEACAHPLRGQVWPRPGPEPVRAECQGLLCSPPGQCRSFNAYQDVPSPQSWGWQPAE